MWRAVLAGVLLANAGCGKKSDDGAAVVAGAPAGTVVAVDGKVTATEGATVRDLAKGMTVKADELIETGADAHITIELAHNHAHWTLGQNQHEKPRASLAWGLAKVEGSAAGVDQVATSAGRNGERSAADTDVTTTAATADKPAAKGDGAPRLEQTREQAAADNAPVTAAPKQPAHPTTPVAPHVGESRRKDAAPPRTESPPPPPPPNIQPMPGGPHSDPKVADSDERAPEPQKLTRGAKILPAALTNDAGVLACVKNGTATLVVTCDDTSCTLTSTTLAPAQACLEAAVKKIKVAAGTYTIKLEPPAPAH